MITQTQIVAAARTYLKTPYVYGGRVKGVGIDCAGLLVCVARDLGLSVSDKVYTPSADNFEVMCSTIAPHCELVEDGSLFAGDILALRGRLMMQHCGIYTGEGTFVHAYNSPGFMRVVEQPLDSSWKMRLVRTYRLSGVSS